MAGVDNYSATIHAIWMTTPVYDPNVSLKKLFSRARKAVSRYDGCIISRSITSIRALNEGMSSYTMSVSRSQSQGTERHYLYGQESMPCANGCQTASFRVDIAVVRFHGSVITWFANFIL